jgi:hypothetical protein
MHRFGNRSSMAAPVLGVALCACLTATAQAQSARGLAPIQQRLLSGFASLVRSNALVGNPPTGGATGINPSAATNYTPGANGSCSPSIGNNVKINQNCENVSDPNLQGRSQSQNETSIAQDPNAPRRMVAAYNDYRRGDGTCGVSFSLNGGTTWQDSTVPNGFVRGNAFGAARQYFQAAGDPSVAFDSKGNVYLSCQMFMRGEPTTTNPDLSSALYVFRSTGNFGASWNFPARPVVEFPDVAGAGTDLLDKQLLAVDASPGSPFQDRIYVTWTWFAADGTAYIYASHSSDYGEHFSAPVVVSGNNAALCTNTYGIATPHGNCNENQYSQPFTAPDGTLYVVWSNFNNPVTGSDNRNQILIAKSTDGGTTFSTPAKVADYYDLPDCATYQSGADFGRACVPEKGPTTNSIFRASNYPSGAVDPTDANRIVVSFGSYINKHSNASNGCIPAGFSPSTGLNLYDGVKTPGACNNDILVSVSTNGGVTFTGTTVDPRSLTSATPNTGDTSDQWFQWLAFTANGQLAISYYDRQYGNSEVTGYSDVSVSGSKDKDATNFAVARATSTSMPPPTQFGGSFWGDYGGLSALDQAHPVWSDTRNVELFVCPSAGTGSPPSTCTTTLASGLLANDQDIFTVSVPVPGR